MTKYVPKTKPFAHQSRCTLRAVREGNLAFFMEPGCGKTKAALDAVAVQHLRGKVNRVAVVAPLSALSVWEDEIEEHFPYHAFIETTDEEWDVNPESNRTVSFFLINYDRISQRQRRGGRWWHPWVQELNDYAPDVLILDESQRVKRGSTNRSRGLWTLVRHLRSRNGNEKPYVWLLSGTPNPKGYLDLFAQFRIMDESIFGTAKATFEDNFCVYGFGRLKWTVIRYRNKEILMEKIRDHAFIITKDECLDLPPIMPPTIHKVQLPDKAKMAYLDMVDEFLAEIVDEDGNLQQLTATHAATKRLRLQQITGGFSTDGKPYHRAKVRMAEEVLEDLHESRENVVVYARFLAEVDALAESAERVGYHTSLISGATTAKRRADAIREFQRSTPLTDTPHALVFQVATGSLAITLTNCANILYYSLPDSWDTYWQSLSRVHRAGLSRSLSHHYILAPGTVDIRQLKSLRGKRDLHAELMGNPEDFLLGR
jgi:SNF2 family DNA or RNA helicase